MLFDEYGKLINCGCKFFEFGEYEGDYCVEKSVEIKSFISNCVCCKLCVEEGGYGNEGVKCNLEKK